VHSAPVYGGTEFLLHNILPQFGIRRIGFAAGSGESMRQAVQHAAAQGTVRMIYVETPANPTNALVDIAACAELAVSLERDGQRPLVAVDNTFLGPLWQQPLGQGADLVLYSLTKYVGGHSDLIAGACLGAESVIAPVRGMRTIFGTMADPMTGWLVMRSLETLKLRMTSSMKNARYVAEFSPRIPCAEGQLPRVPRGRDGAARDLPASVRGAGLDVLLRDRRRRGGGVPVLNALQVAKLAVSLGGTETLAEHPASMTHADVPHDEKRSMGIGDGLIRISVGIEHPDDIIADLRQALAHL
jgi:methionine-gamma-lyase